MANGVDVVARWPDPAEPDRVPWWAPPDDDEDDDEDGDDEEAEPRPVVVVADAAGFDDPPSARPRVTPSATRARMTTTRIHAVGESRDWTEWFPRAT